jgi:hypothetical protein
MVEINTKLLTSFGQRCFALSVAAHAVRERATRDGRDIKEWRLSRLMRDAATNAQVNVAEQNYNVCLRTISSQDRGHTQ